MSSGLPRRGGARPGGGAPRRHRRRGAQQHRSHELGGRDLSNARSITVADILAIHRRLLTGTRLEEHGGVLRTTQNWIGGSEYNPCSAEFIPPPPEHVQALLDDLCAFCNGDSLPAVAQAAMAHAQFETIHPFVDGNGRAGRVLIHVILRRRGLTPHVLPPVSLVLATWAADYAAGLTTTRYRGPLLRLGTA